MTDGQRQAFSAPIAARVVILLIVVVAIGQALTLAIALLVPPPRPAIYRLTEIAAALNGQPVRARDGRLFERTISPATPVIHGRPGPGDQGRAELAQIMGAPIDRILLRETPPHPPVWGMTTLWRGERGFEPRRPRAFAGTGEPPPGPAPDGQTQDQPSRFGPAPGEAGFDLGHERRAWNGGGFAEARRLVFGDFTAALRQPSGSWVVVKPAPEPFPNAWQTRVGLWFLACLAVLGPVGYIFARRLVAPIGAFAAAADRLGRDPNASPIALTGPAEIGIAARAFNTMQTRLQRYVADRTSMIAAISHDLRTPLARVRFKMEQASEGLRASVGSDLDEMEAMITAVLGFVRDASETRERNDLDLLSVLECAVDDAVAAGGRADLRCGDPVVVEADDLALKRLFANLIDNAIKYGACAEVALSVEDGAAVVEVADKGPGLPTGELERVFEPFYRAERSRNRETGGMGLGLAVARSIARAHGGDITLTSGDVGLTAIVRLPLAKLGAAPAAG